MAALINGIKDKLYTLPDDTIVYPGHAESTTIAREKKYNPFIR
jgi:glyoxylase-like metal-dependent hydrolase (beta-lactamase superfamily II)